MARQLLLLLTTFILIVAACVFSERAFSPTFQQCVASNPTSEQNNSAEQNPSAFGVIVSNYVRCSARLVKVYQAAITAVATLVIAAFTGTLWIATSRQAALTRDAFIADKRAFVFANGIAPLYEPDITTNHFNWRIGPVWHNSGDTPTQNMRIYTDGFLSNVPIPPTFDFNQIDAAQPPGAGMLGPKMSSGGGQAPHMPGAALTPQDILDIQNGRKYFYLWGWARYSDTLPDTSEHITRYCWRIISTGNPLIFNPLVDSNGVRFFNLYEARGNCADEECELQGLG
jgi:hypothetical protein